MLDHAKVPRYFLFYDFDFINLLGDRKAKRLNTNRWVIYTITFFLLHIKIKTPSIKFLMTTSSSLETSDFIIFFIKNVLGLFGVYFTLGISGTFTLGIQ